MNPRAARIIRVKMDWQMSFVQLLEHVDFGIGERRVELHDDLRHCVHMLGS